MPFKLTLKPRDSERGPGKPSRYSVMLNGSVTGELGYNVSGYRGHLVTVRGGRLDIGERGISEWKGQVADLNREARAAIATSRADPRKLVSTSLTVDGDRLNARFRSPDGPDETLSVPRDMVLAAREVFGGGVSRAFFETREGPALDRVSNVRAVTPDPGETWERTRFCLQSFKTDRAEWVAVLCGETPDAEALSKGEIESADIRLDPGSASVHFIRTASFLGITNETHGAFRADFVRASALPGHGLMSEIASPFDPPVTSIKDRPTIIAENDEDLWARPFIERQGYRMEDRVGPDSDRGAPAAEQMEP